MYNLGKSLPLNIQKRNREEFEYSTTPKTSLQESQSTEHDNSEGSTISLSTAYNINQKDKAFFNLLAITTKK